MTNDVFLNGVPHSVQTSELTKNAVNPRNTFITDEKTRLDDVSTEFAKHESHAPTTLDTQAESTQLEKTASSYPTTQDSFDTHEVLSDSKKHVTDNFQTFSSDGSLSHEDFYVSLHSVEDRIQNLRHKHLSKNIQHLGNDHLADSMQSLGEVPRLGDNFQKLPPTQSRRDNVLYKEKKNIQENIQRIEAPNVSREQAILGDSLLQDEKSALNTSVVQRQTESASSSQSVEDEWMARLRKMREEIGKVNQSLTDFEDDK